MRRHALIIGAGVFGCSLAYRFACEGWRVSLVDRAEPGGRMSASGGTTRLIRFGYADEICYSRLAWRSRQLWREIERESGYSLFLEVGVTWLAADEGGYEAKSERVLRGLGIPVERLGRPELRELFPELVCDSGLSFGVREPAGGVLRARLAVQTLAGLAIERGAVLRREEALPDEIDAITDWRAGSEDLVFWCCGASLGKLFPGIVPVYATKQSELYLDGSSSWRCPPCGAWIDDGSGVYGIGDIDGDGVKVAWDRLGSEGDPDVLLMGDTHEPEIRDYLRRRFPTLGKASVRSVMPCHYEMAPGGEFVIARHPAVRNTWIVGGGSGHGFKHGPAVAEYVWKLVDRGEEPARRFGLDRVGGVASVR
jgi:sarcosine oxidase